MMEALADQEISLRKRGSALTIFSLAAASPKIIYIPLDNRPVNLEYTSIRPKQPVIP